MKMRMYLEFTHDDVQKEIPYQIIAETMSRSVWDTGRRKRLMKELFTDEERDQVYKIKAQARSWMLYKGVPDDGVKMTMRTYRLWNKLADFCASL